MHLSQTENICNNTVLLDHSLLSSVESNETSMALCIIDLLSVRKINEMNRKGLAAIHIAAINGYDDIITALTTRGADLNMLSGISGQTPLHLATFYNHLNTVSTLIFLGVNVKKLDKVGISALRVARQRGYDDIYSHLSAAGSDVELQECSTANSEKDLILVVRAGDLALVRCIIDSNSVLDTNFKDIDGNTALHNAVLNGYVEIVNELLLHNVRTTIKNNNGFNALMLGVVSGMRSDDIETPQNFDEIVSVLARRGNIDQIDLEGRTALMHASGLGQANMAYLIAQYGADLNMQEHTKGLAALHLAAQRGFISIVDMLIKSKGVDLNVRTYGGNTAIHLAADAGHVDIVNLLLASCADITIKNAEQKTVMNFARFVIDVNEVSSRCQLRRLVL